MFPDGTAPIAQLLDDLDIPVDQSMRKTEKQVREAGHKIRNSLIRAAIQMRREKHLRDPFGLPDTLRKPVENPVENSEKIGAHSGAHPSEHDGAHHRGAPGHTPTNPNEINGAHSGAHSGALSESNRGALRDPEWGTVCPKTDDDDNNLF